MKKLLIASMSSALLLLTGCSSGGDSDEDDTSGSAAVTTPAIATAGKLVVCAALSQGSPPSFYFDDSHKPVGAEVDLAKAVGKDLGLDVEFRDTEFAAIIPTLQAKQCDLVMSSLFIKPERLEVVDMVPYIRSGTSVVVATGKNAEITGMDDTLCGHRMAAVTGTTATALVEEQVKKCKSAGKPDLKFAQNTNVTAGLQQLSNGQIDAYADGTPLILYYMQKREGAYELAGEPFGQIDVGAAVVKGNAELRDAVKASIDALVADGTYDSILDTWNLQDLSITKE